jgi:hypothetical protein
MVLIASGISVSIFVTTKIVAPGSSQLPIKQAIKVRAEWTYISTYS